MGLFMHDLISILLFMVYFFLAIPWSLISSRFWAELFIWGDFDFRLFFTSLFLTILLLLLLFGGIYGF